MGVIVYRQPGDVLPLTAPLGGVVAGGAYVIGGIFVIAMSSAAAGDSFSAAITGTFAIPKASGQVWSEGQSLYWDAANSRCDSLPTAGFLVGVAGAVAGSGDTSGVLRLEGVALPASITREGGLAVWLVNKSGAPSVKGTMVTAGGGVSRGCVPVTAGIPNPIGAVYDAGVADGSLMRVVVSGVAEVLMENGQAPVVGYWVGTSSSANGRAYVQAAPPGGGLPSEITAHNGEIGHCLESKSSGTDVLAMCVLHFN